MPRNASFGRGKSRVDSFEIISAPPRHPVVRVLALLIRLRAELLVLALGVTAWVALGPDHVTGADGTTVAVPGTGTGTGFEPTARAVLFAAVLVLLVGLPWTRRFLFHRAQAVLTRHRVRQALVECRVINFSRACPLTVWARPTRVGEIVWVVLRAGIGPESLANEAEEIAAACFAREARVTAWASMTNVVRVEVIRRDPLAPATIRSELFRWAGGTPDSTDPWTEGPAPRPQATRPAREPAVAAAAAPAIADGGPAGGRGGDWSDYV